MFIPCGISIFSFPYLDRWLDGIISAQVTFPGNTDVPVWIHGSSPDTNNIDPNDIEKLWYGLDDGATGKKGMLQKQHIQGKMIDLGLYQNIVCRNYDSSDTGGKGNLIFTMGIIRRNTGAVDLGCQYGPHPRMQPKKWTSEGYTDGFEL